MSAALFFLPYQAATINGIAAPGAKLYFYATGTLTPLTIFTNSGLSVAASNPVVANGAGQFGDIYLDGTKTHRLIIKDKTGATLADIDPYIPGTSDSALLQPYQDAAAASAAAALASQGAAATSATNAATSATNSANSATGAATSATAASTSAGAASTSATNAGSSATAASGSATGAAASASAAGTSATAAASSATAASGSQTAAATSATNAANSASAASTSATNAATSETNAAASSTAAATQATNAAASAASASNTSATPGTVWGIVDDYSNAAATYMGTDGTIYPAAISPTLLGTVALTEWQRKTFSRNPIQVPADILHVIAYGQSKALGNACNVGTYDAAIPGSALRFNANGVAGAGPRAQDGGGTQAQNHASLVAMVERLNNTSGCGETGLGQFARSIDSLLTTENGLTASTAGFQFLFSAPGQSNTAIAGLAKGTTPYTNLIADVTYGMSLAAAAGKTYNVPAILYSQGERDIVLGTARATYTAALLQLYTDLNTDIKALTGQANDIYIIMYQVDEYDQTNANIALAQTDAAASNAKIVISHPDYCIPHISATNTHYLEDGYAHGNSYYAVTFKRLILDQGSFSPLKQSGTIQRTSNILSVPFNVPVAPLILDNLFFTTQTNSGFTALDHLGADNPITAIAIAYNRLRITLTTADSGTLRYCAGTTFGGNLRDSETRDLGAFRRRQLSNCCLAFEKTFS